MTKPQSDQPETLLDIVESCTYAHAKGADRPGGDGVRSRLEDERNVLENSFGRGSWADGLTRDRIRIIDEKLAALPTRDAAEGADATQAQRSAMMFARSDAAAPPKPAPDEVRDGNPNRRCAHGKLFTESCPGCGYVHPRDLYAPVPRADGAKPIDDDELAGWARSWHWNDCAEDNPVDPSIYFRDMRMLKAFIAYCERVGLPSGTGAAEPVVTEAMEAAALEVHAQGEPFESPFGKDGSFAVVYRAMRQAEIAGAKPVAYRWRNRDGGEWHVVNYRILNSDHIIAEPLGVIVATPPVRGDREALIHAICPHIRQWADSEEVTDFVCKECPAKIKTSQGEGAQLCRINAEKAADAILSLPVQPGAGEREAEWQDMASAPNEEIEVRGIWHTRGGGVDFTHWRPLSRQAPHSSREGGR